MSLREIYDTSSKPLCSVRVIEGLQQATEMAAMEASCYVGSKDKIKVDKAAVDAFNYVFSNNDLFGVHVVIGEGVKDKAPMLAHGSMLGNKARLYDLAIDPVDGTTFAAEGIEGAISVVALSESGTMIPWVDVHYMDKLVVGPKAARALDRNAKVRIGANPRRNLELIAEAYGKNPSELRVALLDRERNANILHAVKGLGATAILLDGGDILPAIETALPESDIDVVYGSGGSPEAILTAAAIAGYGGNMQAMWHPKDDIELQRVHKLGQLNEILYIDDMVGRGEVYFCLTAVTKYKNLLQASSPNGPGDSMSSYSQSR